MAAQSVGQKGAAAQSTCVAPPSSLVSWWDGEGNANDIWGGNNGTLENGVTFVTGEVGQAFHFNAASTQFVQTSNAQSLNFERTDPFTIDAWIRTTDTTVNEFVTAKRLATSPLTGYGVVIDNGPPNCQTTNTVTAGAGVVTFFLDNSDNANCPRDHAIIVHGTTSVTDGQFHLIAVTYDGSGTAAGVKIYVDGVLDTMLTESDTLAATTTTNDSPLLIGIDNTGVQPFDGDIDEFEVSNSALSASDIQGIFNAGSAGKCKPSVTCVAPPTGMVAWFPGDGNTNDIWGGNSGGSLQNGATFAQSLVSQGFSLDNSQNQFVEIPDASSLRFGPTSPMSVDMWVFRTSGSQTQHFIGKRATCNGSAIDGTFQMGLDFVTSAGCGVFFGPPNLPTVCSGLDLPIDQWSHLAGTFDGTTQRLYINGQLVGSQAAPLGSSNTAPLLIGQTSLACSSTVSTGGLVDEVELFNRALSASEVQSIVNARTQGKCKPTQVTGRLLIEPPRVNFGTVILNQSRTKKFKIVNAGHTTKFNHPAAITIQTETETGSPSPDPFSVSTLCSSDALLPHGRGVLPSQNTCQVFVTFAPTQAVTYSGTLTIFDNLAPNGTQTVPLLGKGRAP